MEKENKPQRTQRTQSKEREPQKALARQLGIRNEELNSGGEGMKSGEKKGTTDLGRGQLPDLV